MITGIAHLCIASTDLDRTLAFYAQALGFEKRFAFLRNDGEIGYYLQVADRAYVEVFLQEHAPSLEQPAIRHVCLQVEGIDDTIRQIRQAGYEASDKKLGVDHTWQAWTTDPDGIRIELHEYTEKSSQFTGEDVTVDW